MKLGWIRNFPQCDFCNFEPNIQTSSETGLETNLTQMMTHRFTSVTLWHCNVLSIVERVLLCFYAYIVQLCCIKIWKVIKFRVHPFSFPFSFFRCCVLFQLSCIHLLSFIFQSFFQIKFFHKFPIHVQHHRGDKIWIVCVHLYLSCKQTKLIFTCQWQWQMASFDSGGH